VQTPPSPLGIQPFRGAFLSEASFNHAVKAFIVEQMVLLGLIKSREDKLVSRWSAQATADYLTQNTKNMEEFSATTVDLETVQRAIRRAPDVAEGSEEAARLMLWQLSDAVFNDEVKQRLIEVLRLLQVIPSCAEENVRTPSALKRLVRESRARELSQIQAQLDEALQQLSSIRSEIESWQQPAPELESEQPTSASGVDEADAALQASLDADLLEELLGMEAHSASVCAQLEQRKTSHLNVRLVRAEDVARLLADQTAIPDEASALVRCALENAGGIANGENAAAFRLMEFVEVIEEVETPVEPPSVAEPIKQVDVAVSAKSELCPEMSSRLISAFKRVFKTMNVQVDDLETTYSKPEGLARAFALKLQGLVSQSPRSGSGSEAAHEELEAVCNQYSPSPQL
jgi:hypothetical protein